MTPWIKIPPALKYRNFALFWGGSFISNTGSQMQFWALLWHLSTLTNDPVVVSGVGLVRFVPILIFSLLGGLAADSFNRRTIMFFTQSTMMLAALALGLLTMTGQIQIWHIYLLTAIQALASSFDGPARQSLVPNLIPREVYSNAFSLQSIAMNTGSIVGPALNGLVVSTLGLEWVYLINAATFLMVLGALQIIGDIPQLSTLPQGQRRAVSLSAIREGIAYIAHQPVILSSMVLDFWATFFSSANTLLPFVARNVLNVSVVEYGWLSSGQAIGAVLVGLLFSQRSNIRQQGKLLLAAVVAFGLATIVFGLSRTFWLTLFALVFIGASDSVSTILRNTIRQIQTPDAMRGRMVSINQIFFMGGPQLGEIEAGLVAQFFGVPAAIISGGAGCIIAVAIVAKKWPQLKDYTG